LKRPPEELRSLTHVSPDGTREPSRRPLDFGLIRRLFTYTRPHARLRNWLIVLVLMRAVQLPLLAWAMGAVINGPVARGSVRGTWLGAAGFILLALSTQVTFYFRIRQAQILGERVIYDLRNQLFAHILRMPMSFFHRTKLGRLISRMTTDVESVRNGVQEVFFVSCVQGGQSLVAAVIMLILDVRLFGTVLIMAPLIWVLNRLFRQRLSDATRASQESFSRVTATMAESVSGIRVTQGFAREETNADIFQELVEDHSRYNLDISRTSGMFLPLLELSGQLVTSVLVVVGAHLVLRPDQTMPVGVIIQFFFLSSLFFAGVQGLGTMYNQAMMAMAGAERVFRLLDTPPDWTDDPGARPVPALQGRVEVRNVTFGYDPAQPVLHNIEFVAEPGQTVALVGHTGSGKTSIVNLLAKFYLPGTGDILFDGTSMRDITSDSLHGQMAIIQQNNFLMTGTIFENIRLGNPRATDADIVDAARKLDCLDLIESLPDGFNTRVGERGVGISLGQRQLVCFVRALVANPRILILDEATSSVDTLTELRVQKALSNLLSGRTCFVVAHRLSTVRHADQVLVLDRGRIVERGRHAELVGRRGLYASLYRQFVRLGLGWGATTARPPPGISEPEKAGG
jgi:ATP-binding cassette, subfamily B, bacterial